MGIGYLLSKVISYLRSLGRKVLFRVAISAILLGLMLWRVDIDDAFQVFLDVRYAYVVPALLLYSASKLLDTQRWKMMLERRGHAPLLGLYGVFLVSNVANNFLPVRIGDLIRVQVPAQRYHLPRATVTATVFVTETLADGVAFVILGLIGIALLDAPDPITKLTWSLLGVVIVGLLLAGWAARLHLSPRWHEHPVWVWLPSPLHNFINDFVPPFVHGLAALGDYKLGLRILVLSLVAWLLEATMYWLLGYAFGLDLSFGSYIIIMIAANMIVSMPVAPSNIGPYEVAVTEVVIALGADRGLAGGFAIGTHLMIIVWTTIWGFTAMWLMNLDFGDVFRIRREPSPRPSEVEPA